MSLEGEEASKVIAIDIVLDGCKKWGAGEWTEQTGGGDRSEREETAGAERSIKERGYCYLRGRVFVQIGDCWRVLLMPRERRVIVPRGIP